VTVLDTGIDLAHPEFSGRADTIALNTITFDNDDRGSHGTAVGLLVAAPVNGVGLAGIYPRARLQVWDGYDLSFGAVIAGLAAASRLGPGVINLSLGYTAGAFGGDLLQPIVDAVNATVRRGSVVVAAAGNGRQDGSRELTVRSSSPSALTPTSISSSGDLGRRPCTGEGPTWPRRPHGPAAARRARNSGTVRRALSSRS
jgi:subtilisin family serine protease